MKTWMCALMLALSTGASAQNPIISGQYSADPTARVFRLTVILRCKARVLVLNIWIKQLFAGWKTLFSKSNTALIYNKVDFGNEKVAEITVRAKSSKGGVLVVRADGKKGNIIAKVKIPKSAAWKNVRAQVLHAPQGVHALHVSLQSGADVEVDWLGFI